MEAKREKEKRQKRGELSSHGMDRDKGTEIF
jgi:hypothetical protein